MKTICSFWTNRLPASIPSCGTRSWKFCTIICRTEKRRCSFPRTFLPIWKNFAIISWYIHEGRVLFDEEKDALLEKFVTFSCEKAALKELDPARVERVLLREYGADVLVRKDCLPQGFGGEQGGPG